jgi:hypothetical protein
MDKESDVELEEINWRNLVCSPAYSQKINTKENTFTFQLELVMCQMSLILLDPQMAINQAINQPNTCLQHTCKSPSSRWFLQITLHESNHYFHYYIYSPKHNKYFSTTNQYYNWGNIHIFCIIIQWNMTIAAA